MKNTHGLIDSMVANSINGRTGGLPQVYTTSTMSLSSPFKDPALNLLSPAEKHKLAIESEYMT